MHKRKRKRTTEVLERGGWLWWGGGRVCANLLGGLVDGKGQDSGGVQHACILCLYFNLPRCHGLYNSVVACAGCKQMCRNSLVPRPHLLSRKTIAIWPPLHPPCRHTGRNWHSQPCRHTGRAHRQGIHHAGTQAGHHATTMQAHRQVLAFTTMQAHRHSGRAPCRAPIMQAHRHTDTQAGHTGSAPTALTVSTGRS